MTRSDNPFGDLPEWKERRRLQEAQEQHGYASRPPEGYPQSHDPQALPQQYTDDRLNGYGRDDVGQKFTDQDYGRFDRDGYEGQYAPQGAPQAGHGGYYQSEGQYGAQPSAEYHSHGRGAPRGRAPLHYELGPSPIHGTGHPSQIDHTNPQYGGGPPSAPVYEQGGVYQDPDVNYHDPTVQDGGYVHQDFSGHGGYSDQGGGQGSDTYGLRHGQYDDGLAYDGGVSYENPNNPQPGYGLGAAVPGQLAYQPGHADAPADYYNENDPNGQWNEAGERPHGNLALTGAQAIDEEDEYEDDDEPMRFSWKLLAAVVVTGAVVAGGGVVLYDSFASGHVGKNGNAPIIRADQGPAKIAPGDAGGRKFAHQDSKLLGRLDNSGSSDGADSDAANRVRAVPTVRVGRDGRLILPKAPETVPAASESGSAVASGGESVGGESSTSASPSVPVVPGLNVVDSINGNGTAPFGTLPPALPKSEQAEPPQAPDIRQASAPEMRASNVPATSRQPVIKNRSTANRATASGAPPVPTKSSVGTAWRMSGTPAAPTSSTQSNKVQPTIAQSVSLLPSSTASTLGAAPATTPATGQGGYVAVLATATSRMKALQSFAELQQKHPNALVNRVPDVQRADLSSRGLGIMYRVVVGSGGSRSAANSVCASLKAEGYNGCWVKTN